VFKGILVNLLGGRKDSKIFQNLLTNRYKKKYYNSPKNNNNHPT
jgi:hypothetical protein